MDDSFNIVVNDYRKASQIKGDVHIGHYFVFQTNVTESSIQGRFRRLLVNENKTSNKVFPLVHNAVNLAGVTISPETPVIDNMGCIVSDRDLYRAEQDNINIFIAFPKPPKDLYLIIKHNDKFLVQRKVALRYGVCIETFPMLLAGRYEAQLSTSDRDIGVPISFTVAEYTLAPLSARLLKHELNRGEALLSFELAVESYQKPFTGELLVTLIGAEDTTDWAEEETFLAEEETFSQEALNKKLADLQDDVNVYVIYEDFESARNVLRTAIANSPDDPEYRMKLRQMLAELQFEAKSAGAEFEQLGELKTQKKSKVKLLPQSPGYYVGSLKMQGKGPFRLRLMAVDDAERVAEVVIPGSRKTERQVTLISELGQEQLFSMMPEANAIPLRGGYLSEGDFIATPLTVKEIVTQEPSIQVNANVESLVLINLDLASGNYQVQKVGNVWAGNSVPVENCGAMSTVFIGAFVDGKPFEGYTTFIKPHSFELLVDVPKTVRPRTDLMVNLSCNELKNKTIPVLVCIRDQRLTATDKPEVSLGASAKRGIENATANMDKRSFISLEEATGSQLNPPSRWRRGDEETSFALSTDDDLAGLGGDDDLSLDMDVGDDAGLSDDFLAGLGGDDDLPLEMDSPHASTTIVQVERGASSASVGRSEPPKSTPPAQPVEKQKRTDFPEVLFYDIVLLKEKKTLIIPLRDSLSTFSVETFAMVDGDWTQHQTTVVVDQPVRVELELPVAVHSEDKVRGRLYATTQSGKATISLKCEDEPVALIDGKFIDSLDIKTPIELEFYVKSGAYNATITDSVSGESDSIEKKVGEPGKFKSRIKELGLLIDGDSIILKESNILSLRVLPSVDTSFDNLINATANYSHLCCEQTAAKILAATFMYLTAKSDAQRNTAEHIILAGIAREQRMIWEGRGFRMYPSSAHVNDYYSRLAVLYLWKLMEFNKIPSISNRLRMAVEQGLSLANKVATAHRMTRIPKQIQTIEDAYVFVSAKKDRRAVLQFIEKYIDFSRKEATLKNAQQAVANRKFLAYAAACLIAFGDLRRGIRIANQVTRQINEDGRLYSTVDSVAAIALMTQLNISGITANKALLRVNEKEMTISSASELEEPIESIEVIDGVVAVEATCLHEEDWNQYAYKFPVKIGFRDKYNNKMTHFKSGARTDLVVSLPDGYRAGDLMHVALPASLSWIQGGGKVKQFSLDFEGKNELRIPLVVTSDIEGTQHFAVSVRNMFEEERATSPGLLTIKP